MATSNSRAIRSCSPRILFLPEPPAYRVTAD
jgi:hypothetical protein